MRRRNAAYRILGYIVLFGFPPISDARVESSGQSFDYLAVQNYDLFSWRNLVAFNMNAKFKLTEKMTRPQG